jgi:hypothetical protein
MPALLCIACCDVPADAAQLRAGCGGADPPPRIMVMCAAVTLFACGGLFSSAASGPAQYSIGLLAQATPFPHHWEECVGSGHASLTLRADWRSHLTRARHDLGVKRTRFHGLLDDDFSLSIGPRTGDGDPADKCDHCAGSDSYVNLDSLIDFYDTLGMDTPIFEISFMPQWLATSHADAHRVTHYKGITAPPKNYTEWGGVVQRMAEHLRERYPQKKIMWEVWKYGIQPPTLLPPRSRACATHV